MADVMRYGLQRQTAALEALKNGIHPLLGFTIHFDATDTMENKRFGVVMSRCPKLTLIDRLRLRNLGLAKAV